ncbi:peroxisomal sarcosine oxidase-like [Gigantopelta aegis]|uniref:peroxisomal sarcosine oxidase-like n=1 Tax=Gigantopelta aegis TaxID=1735272 RepID=UPI001B88BD8F|nr:peroxisomal sarcosine oxidase-like [Gigantopelta aegis]
MAPTVYDVIVVGAGIEGSATAHYLVNRGKHTLLLEQFPLPHSRGSSHGQSRVIRKAYTDYFYSNMMHEATQMWLELQNSFGVKLYKQSGYLSIGDSGGKFLTEIADSMSRAKASYQMLTKSEFKASYPMMKYPSTFTGVLDHDGGILRADKALQAFQSEFTRHGGELIDGCRVTRIIPGSTVTVKTPNATFRGQKVIVTAGPWTSSVMNPLGLHLPLKPTRINVYYWKELECGSHSAGKFRPFVEVKCCEPHYVYGLPSDEYPGHVKICFSYGPEIDPENRDSVDDSWCLGVMKKYIRDHFPGLDASSPSIVESCIITNTPDKHPILDKHPRWENIVVGAGFSGHGFKLSPVIGKLLGQMALREAPAYDVTRFRIDRFQTSSKL